MPTFHADKPVSEPGQLHTSLHSPAGGGSLRYAALRILVGLGVGLLMEVLWAFFGGSRAGFGF